MSYENIIQKSINTTLKNPITKVLKEIKVDKLLKQSGFVKKEGASPSIILFGFISMIMLNKSIGLFVKQAKEALGKDVYYRALINPNYNYRKLLMLISVKLIDKIALLHKGKMLKVLILDDTIEDKRGKKIEGVCDKLWSNKDKRSVRGLNIVSLNYNDGYSNFMVDFAMKFNKNLKVTLDAFKHNFYQSSEGYKRQHEGLSSKLDIAISMVKRALKAGIEAQYLLVDSWYSKPIFIQQMKELNLEVISRIANNPKIWNFDNRYKTLNRIYAILIKTKPRRADYYNSIKYTYCSTIVKHKSVGRVKIVFIKTKNKLIPILSTNIKLTDKQIIEIYKRRWNIEQGYKELRAYFGFGKEENRIHEALIARITLSFISYNLVSYINRINHEPQTLGGLFRDLECELHSLAISMEFFLQILQGVTEQLEKQENEQNAQLILDQLIGILGSHIKSEVGFWCES